MKALTNILNYMLLMLLLLIPAACTEETAEVDNLSRGEQYVTVRMNIPGMTATATRAADGVIETIHALAFDTNKKLLGVRTATNINNANDNVGFNGTFNIIVPNGTETIHFLANNTVSLPEVGADVSVLTSLTTGDYNNLCYWGMATTSDGNTNDLNVTLYRNLAKISIKPSVGEDAVFNDFTQEELIISGLMNPNRVGKLVPYNNDSFYSNQSGTAPDYLTLPDNPDPLDKTPIGNDGAGYGNWLYVFEHDNPKDFNTGLFVICNIGGAYYKVALVDTNGEPYPIIRNHEYIIYVSDVDDYSYDDNYRAGTYEEAFEKLPINLEVVEAMYVDFQYDNSQALQLGNTFTVTMTVPEGGTLTDFSITAEGFTFDQPATSYSTGTYTFNFTPTSVGSKTITFTGTGSENLNGVSTTIDVNVTASINANADKQQLYYDSDEDQIVTVQVTVPAGVETLNISAADFSPVSADGGYTVNGDATNGYSVSLAAEGDKQINFTFTLDEYKYSEQTGNTSTTITFSDGSGNATEAPVIVYLVETPVVTFTPDETSKTMNVNDTYNVTMNGTLTALSIAAEGFTVTSSSGGLSGPTNNVYTYAGGTTTFTFTPTSAGDYTIRFYDGQGENINVPDKEIAVTVNAAITATAKPSTIYYDGDDKTTTVSVTIPKGVSALNITATDFTVALQSGNGNLNGNTYTLNDTNGQIAVFVFTYTGAQSESTQTITFNDATNNDNVNGASVTILVKKAEIDVPVLVEGENILQLDKLPLTLGNNNGIVLLKANGNNESGLLESYRNYIAENVTLKITFTSDGEANPLSFQTTWSGELEEEYSSDSSMKYLSYTFKSTDFEKGNGGENTIANAGLKLQAASNSNSTITAISIIIPASTTE